MSVDTLIRLALVRHISQMRRASQPLSAPSALYATSFPVSWCLFSTPDVAWPAGLRIVELAWLIDVLNSPIEGSHHQGHVIGAQNLGKGISGAFALQTLGFKGFRTILIMSSKGSSKFQRPSQRLLDPSHQPLTPHLPVYVRGSRLDCWCTRLGPFVSTRRSWFLNFFGWEPPCKPSGASLANILDHPPAGQHRYRTRRLYRTQTNASK